MKKTSFVYGHSVSVTGFRLGKSILWDNRLVQPLSDKEYSISLLGYFWYNFFYKFFYLRTNKRIYFLWTRFFGLLLESLIICQVYKTYKFRFNVYIDLFNFLSRKILRGLRKKSFLPISNLPNFSRRYKKKTPKFKKFNSRRFSKPRIFSNKNSRRGFFNRANRARFFSNKSPFCLNLLNYSDFLIRERHFLFSRLDRRLQRNRSRIYTTYFNLQTRKFAFRREFKSSKPYSTFLVYRPYSRYGFYRLYNRTRSRKRLLRHRVTKYLVRLLMRRFERYFYFYKLFRGVFSFIKQIVSRELLTFYQAKEFEVRILTSNSFVYPNVTSQFIILKLRKWYRVGEIFGILKKMFSQRSMLGGLLVRAKGRLTKRQRATRQKFQIGSMPFSSPLAPLFYFHKAYPLKYGASSISVSFYLCVCRNIKYL